MAENNKMSLAAKLARIGKEIGKVDKSGTNTQQNYKYIEYGTVAGRIRELFDEYSVIIVPCVEDVLVDEITNKYGNIGYHYRIKMLFTIINGDDPNDKLESHWMGESADFGDKGVNKAETSGTKYFLMRLFNVSEKGEEEADSKTPEMQKTKPKQVASASTLAEPPTEDQRKILTAYLMELGKTDEEIEKIFVQIKTKPAMELAISKAEQMIAQAEAAAVNQEN